MKPITIEKCGDIICAKGDNWHFNKLGSHSKFMQYGKVELIRRVKQAIERTVASTSDNYQDEIKEETIELLDSIKG